MENRGYVTYAYNISAGSVARWYRDALGGVFSSEAERQKKSVYDLSNLNCVHGALLRMNRSIQAEGTFGGIKWNKGYKRLRRRGIEGVILELGLISCGFNLYKYHLRKLAMQKSA